MLLHNLQPFIRLLHFVEIILVSFFFKVLNTTMDCLLLGSAALPFLPSFFNCPTNSLLWITFGSESNSSIYLNQLILVDNDFWCNHNVTIILLYNLGLELLLALLFVHIVLYQNQWLDHKSSFCWRWTYNSW